MASAHKLFSMPTNYKRHSLHRLGQPAAAETKLLYYHTQMHLFSCALCYTTLQDDPEIFTADGPPGGQPPYRTAPLFAVETRPLHHHQTPEYNCQKKGNGHKIVSGKDDTTVDCLILIKRVQLEI